MNRWAIAVACGIINFLIIGGVRLTPLWFVASMGRYDSSRQTTSFPYMLCFLMKNLLGPVIGYVGHKYGLRETTLCGCVVASVGLGGCCFAQDITAVTLFWGVLYGLGLGFSTTLLPTILHEHFESEGTLANGVALAGSSLGGLILPAILQSLLHTYGLSGSQLILSAIILNSVPATLVLMISHPNIFKNGKSTINSTDQNASNKNRKKEIQCVYFSEIPTSKEQLTNNISKGHYNNAFNLNDEKINSFNLTLKDDTLSSNAVPSDNKYTSTVWRYLFPRWREKLATPNHNCKTIYEAPAQLNVSNLPPNVPTLQDVSAEGIFTVKCVSTLQDVSVEDNLTAQCVSTSQGISGDDIPIDKCVSTLQDVSGDDIPIDKCVSTLQDVSAEGVPIDKCVSTLQDVSAEDILIDKCVSPSQGVAGEVIPTAQCVSTSQYVSAEGIPIDKYVSTSQDVSAEGIPIDKYVSTSPDVSGEGILTVQSESKFLSLRIFCDPTFIAMMVTQSLYTFVVCIVWTIIFDYVRDKGIGDAPGVYLVMVLAIADLVGRLCLAWVTDMDYLSLVNFGSICFICMGIGTMLLVWSRGFVFIIFAEIFYSLFAGALTVQFPGVITEFMNSEDKTMAMASRNIMQAPLSLLASPLIGYFRSTLQSYDGIFYLTGVICFFCGGITLLIPILARCTNRNHKKV